MKIFQKYGIIGLAFILLLPSILNSNHVFAHEFNFGCDDTSTTHIHQSNLGCELCKFHPTPIISLQLFNFNPYEPLPSNKEFNNYYEFLSEYQKLSFVLRGPPTSRNI